MHWLVPTGWQFVLLALAAFRINRLLAEDTVPPMPQLRNWAAGAKETAGIWTFKRPKIADLIQCPWCLGFHVSWAVWLLWIAEPRWMLVAVTPLAVSAAVALITSNLTSA